MTSVDKVELLEGFRYIEYKDTKAKIRTNVNEMDRYNLSDYYEWSRQKDSLVIIREIEGSIAAVVHLRIKEEYIVIEMLARNKLLQYKGAAGDLLLLVEKLVARHYRKEEIRLESMKDVVSYYNDKGYEKYGEPYHDPQWGLLTPMVKRLTSL